MFDFLDNSVVFALISLVVTFGSLFMVYLEMPAKVDKKTGKTRPLSERLSKLSRDSKVFLFVFVVSAVGSVASVIDIILT